MTAKWMTVCGLVAGLLASGAGSAAAEEWRTAHKAAEGAVGVELSYMDRSNPNEPTASIVLVFKQNQGADYLIQRVRLRCAEGQWLTYGGVAFDLEGTRIAAVPVDEANNPWMPVAGTAGAAFHQAICNDVWAAPATFEGRTQDYARAMRRELTTPAG